ncbi:hypothetical protein OU426_06295 [Frigidibacter sp. RF13]|uniref:COG4223 family protein n=1 Tax=Frigidibacter sp. RF13 TaxID=2997340 RepID=UPI002271BCE1|nr:hypothetical protein [Frigidibacter sp. RF13]MCY1126462.1 hypothetical protein [Frigidibacter sp. RF13]
MARRSKAGASQDEAIARTEETPAEALADEPLALAMPNMDEAAEPPPEAQPPQPEVQAAPQAPRRAGFWPLAFGGALAAAVGAGGAVAVLRANPGLMPPPSTAGLEQRLSDQDKRLSDLSAQLAAAPAEVPAAAPDLQPLIDPLTARLDQVEAALSRLQDRVTALESRPAAPSGDISAATNEAVAAAKAAEAEAARIRQEAEAIARKAAISSALGQIDTGLESGAALAPSLKALSDLGIAAPDPLIAVDQGAPTLAALRDSFPAAARDALSLSLAALPKAGTWDRVSAFLRSQTGARSLSPRAGDDPDAVLSRAEAALGAGDLMAAVAEISALPDAGQARMSEWVGLATKRSEALKAAAALRAEVSQ